MSIKKLFGASAKLLIAGVVFSFLALQSWNFFTFTFPADQWYYAYLGFGLTGGGAIGYLVVIKSGDADTSIKRFVALGMTGICVIGELLTAGFGMQIEAWKSAGLSMTKDAFQFMVLAVQMLGLAHALALILYMAFDDIAKWFADENHNGIPDGFERKPKPAQVQPQRQPVPVLVKAAETEQQKIENPTDPSPQK